MPLPKLLKDRRLKTDIHLRDWKENRLGTVLDKEPEKIESFDIPGKTMRMPMHPDKQMREMFERRVLSLLGARKAHAISFYYRATDGAFFIELHEHARVPGANRFFRVTDPEVIEALKHVKEMR